MPSPDPLGSWVLDSLNVRYHDHFVNETQIISGVKNMISGLTNVKYSSTGEDRPESDETILTIYEINRPLNKVWVDKLLDTKLADKHEKKTVKSVVVISNVQHTEQFDFAGDVREARIEMDFHNSGGAWWAVLDNSVVSHTPKIEIISNQMTIDKQTFVIRMKEELVGVGFEDSTKFLGAVLIHLAGEQNAQSNETRRISFWYVPKGK